MKRKEARKPDDPAQSKRFIDMAREAGADETKDSADRAFKKVNAKITSRQRIRSSAK